MPRISVVIPSYNAARFISEAIDSVLAQTRRPFEIIVVDDGSLDDTARRVAAYGDTVRYFYQPKKGVSAARNLGIKAARGSHIAFLDADDVWLPEKLARQADCLHQHPDAGLLHSDVLVLKNGTTTYLPRGRERYVGWCYQQFFWENRVLTSTVLASKDVLVASGLFDETITGFEDADLWLRVARSVPFAFVPEPLIHYRLHGTNTISNTAAMSEGYLQTYTKAAHCDPHVAKRPEARTKLGQFAAEAAYWMFDAGELEKARRYASRAIRYGSLDVRNYMIFASTLLPGALIRGLRVVNRKIRQSAA